MLRCAPSINQDSRSDYTFPHQRMALSGAAEDLGRAEESFARIKIYLEWAGAGGKKREGKTLTKVITAEVMKN